MKHPNPKLRRLLREQKPIDCLDQHAYVTALSTALQMSMDGIPVTRAQDIRKAYELKACDTSPSEPPPHPEASPVST